jgi:hypothetical protein
VPYDGQVSDYVKTNTVADVLRRAKALIDTPEKWCKQPFLSGGYPRALCANLAIFEAAPGNCRIQELVSNLLWMATGMPGGNNVPWWNDAPERTHAEVMNAFDRAIELAEREG